MNIKKKDFNKILIVFLFSHLIIWTLIPTISNDNLPLDVIEAIAWGNGWPWGWEKHPPLSAWFPELFYQIFGNQDWSYYFLSQIFVVISFFIILKFSEDFFKEKIYQIIAIFLLEGIYFYNFTTPEFNVNVCQLPFWSLTVYYCWKGIKQDDYTSWLLLGIFAACGVLSKYLFIYLLLAIDIYFIYLITNKKFKFKCLTSLITFFVVLAPHIFWLIENDFITISYGLNRAGVSDPSYLNHIFYPIIFLGKQIAILLPVAFMFLFLISKFKFKLNFKDKKLIFLLIINFVPIILVFLTSLFLGAKIRTMWMTPFYLFSSVLIVYIFQKIIILKKIKHFLIVFLTIFILSLPAYFYISISQDDKRTDYPGKMIASAVQEKWNNNFSNNIGLVGGDVWHGGNLSYHLENRPKWDDILNNKKNIILENKEDGFVLVGNSDILSKICRGIFFELSNQGFCMVGKK